MSRAVRPHAITQNLLNLHLKLKQAKLYRLAYARAKSRLDHLQKRNNRAKLLFCAHSSETPLDPAVILYESFHAASVA